MKDLDIRIKAIYKGKYVGDLEAIRFVSAREPHPVYTIEQAKHYVPGKKSIAGSLRFIQFDCEPIYSDLANPTDSSKVLYFTSGPDDLCPENNESLPWMPDPIPPFDIVMTAANEYGDLAIMKLLGVQLLNNGRGVSCDDIVGEHSYNFIAERAVPWTPVRKEENHEGQIYNPITDTWSWL